MAGTSKINLQICPFRHRHHHRNHIRLSEFPLNRCVKSSGVFSSVRKEFPSLKLTMGSSSLSSNFSVFQGHRIGFALQHRLCVPRGRHRMVALTSQMRSGLIGKAAQKWWDKGTESPNMKEVKNAQHLVDSLLNAGDKLVVVDFFSPGCGGCKALHPKICQLAEMNPNVEFLKVNFEEHKSMCHSLNVHVLPFFRFYRGVHGRLCSFSCTNTTIKKFKDALARHGTDRCSLGPPRGLEEKLLLALAANKDLSFSYAPPEPSQLAAPLRSSPEEKETAAASLATPLASAGLKSGRQPDLVVAGR